KFKGLRQFLEAGEKVKVTIMFRGREMVHQEIGRKILERVADDARQFAVVERQPLLEGKNLFMILAPSRGQGATKEQAATSALAQDAERDRQARPRDQERQADARRRVEEPPARAQVEEAQAKL